MKKKIYFFMTFIFILLILFFNCQQSGSSSGGGGGGGDGNTPDPFAGITNRDMVSITGGTYNQRDTYGNNFDHTVSSFSMGKYEVTYELWYTVYQWAITKGYNFANAGAEGDNGIVGAAPTVDKYEPVTHVSWRDAIVWCNAYSQMSGLTQCYTYSDAVIKDSSDSNATACDGAVCTWSNNGYRLPTEGESQFAASYIDGLSWIPSNYASGAYTFYNDIADVNPANGVVDGKDANDTVAVYSSYWDGFSWVSIGVTKSANVGTKQANALTIFDLSGNIFEWCWDFIGDYPVTAQTDYRGIVNGTTRVIRGGGFDGDASFLQVGFRDAHGFPYGAVNDTGFRVVRTY